MERNISMSLCCCCGESMPSEFVISIGNFQRVCVECAHEIDLAMTHKQYLFEKKLPVLAVVKTSKGCERMVLAEENTDHYFNRFEDARKRDGLSKYDAYKVVEVTEEYFKRIADEAADAFEADPMLRRAYFDHYEIAQWMAINSTGNETESDMKRLLIDGWKAVSKDRMDNAEDLYYDADHDWSDPDDRRDISEKVWVPFPSEDAILFLFEQMLNREDVQRARASNAAWQAKENLETEDEE